MRNHREQIAVNSACYSRVYDPLGWKLASSSTDALGRQEPKTSNKPPRGVLDQETNSHPPSANNIRPPDDDDGSFLEKHRWNIANFVERLREKEFDSIEDPAGPRVVTAETPPSQAMRQPPMPAPRTKYASLGSPSRGFDCLLRGNRCSSVDKAVTKNTPVYYTATTRTSTRQRSTSGQEHIIPISISREYVRPHLNSKELADLHGLVNSYSMRG